MPTVDRQHLQKKGAEKVRLWQGLQLPCAKACLLLCFTRPLAFPSHLHVAHGQIAAHTGAVLRLYLESAHLHPDCDSSPRPRSPPLLALNLYLLSPTPHTTWSQHGDTSVLLLHNSPLASHLLWHEIFCHVYRAIRGLAF